jgi:hypothetical protein
VIVFALVVIFLIGASLIEALFVNNGAELRDLSLLIYPALLLFLIPFVRRYEPLTRQAMTVQFGHGNIINHNHRVTHSLKMNSVSMSLISHIGPFNLIYNCFKLFKLLKIRRQNAGWRADYRLK